MSKPKLFLTIDETNYLRVRSLFCTTTLRSEKVATTTVIILELFNRRTSSSRVYVTYYL